MSDDGLDMNDLKAAYDWCRIVTKKEAKNFYYAFLTLPPKQRRAIYATYAFSRLCDDAADEDYPTSKKLELLTGLRDQLSAAFAGNPTGPVFTAVAHAASTYHIAEELYHELITGVETDLTKNRYQDFDELHTYCHRVASVVGLICIEIFGYRDPRAREYAIDLGLAMQLTNIIRDVKEDLQRDRIYIPQDDIIRFGYSEERLMSGLMDNSFRELMHFEAQRARSYFSSGLKLIPILPPRSRPCPAVLARLYLRILDRAEATGFNVFDGKISLSRSEKLFLTARVCMETMLPLLRPVSSG